MSHALVIAGRELAEKRFVFFAAIAFALLATLLPLVPGLHSSPRDVIGMTSLILTCGFTLGLAAILGATIVGRDLSAGRLSFYFARPVAATSIWFGKLAAAAALVIASFLIIIFPALVASAGRLTRTTMMDLPAFALVVGIGSVALFVVAHALSTMIRSRSLLIGIDFAAAIATGAILWQLARPLLASFFALRALLVGFGVAIVIAFIAAGAWQLVDGRVDRRRSHAAFSTALWSGLGVALLLAGGYLAWILSASPRDIDRIVNVEPSPRGDWVLVRGIVRHRFEFEPVFLMNAASGEARRIAPTRDAIFSADGSKFLDLEGRYPRAEIIVHDIASGGATPTDVMIPPFGAAIVATDDLARFAVFDSGLVTIFDVGARRSVASARLTASPWNMFFASPDVVRIYTGDPSHMTAYELDAAHRALRKTGSLATSVFRVRATADGARIVTTEPSGIVVRDARTLQLLGVVSTSRPARAAVLRDGRIITILGTTLHVAGTSTDIELGRGMPWLLLDLGGGKLAVGMGTGRARWITVVDVDRGTVLRREAGLTLPTPGFMMFDPRPQQWTPNLVVVRGGSIVRWNALTGKTKVLVPG